MAKLLNAIRPWARSMKYGRLYRRARREAEGGDKSPLSPPPCFVLGCGRSGTTIAGSLLAAHPDVQYLREPYYIWRAVDPASDMVRFFGDAKTPPRCIMGAEAVTETSQARFSRCMRAEIRRGGHQACLIEKSPINAMRIPFIDGVAPGCKVMHLVRNGIDVVRSIERLARTNTYQLGGGGDWNQWWGRDDCKWDALVRDAAAYDWFKEDLDALDGDLARGALEWLVSLGEIERHRDLLGERLIEVRYDRLAEHPREELARVREHFGLTEDPAWMDACCERLDTARRNPGTELHLPPRMAEAFNDWQARYDFEGRAGE